MDAERSIYPQRVRKRALGNMVDFGLPSIDDRVSMHRPGRRQTWHDGRGHEGAGNSVGAATEARSGSRWISVDFWRDVGFCARMTSARMGRDKL